MLSPYNAWLELEGPSWKYSVYLVLYETDLANKFLKWDLFLNFWRFYLMQLGKEILYYIYLFIYFTAIMKLFELDIFILSLNKFNKCIDPCYAMNLLLFGLETIHILFISQPVIINMLSQWFHQLQVWQKTEEHLWSPTV